MLGCFVDLRVLIVTRYLQFTQDVTFNAPILKHKLLNTSYWQYIYNNGPESLFRGYCWSLDVYMDYAWARLGTLSSVVLILMIIEVSVHLRAWCCCWTFRPAGNLLEAL